MKQHYLLQFFTWEHLPAHLQAVSKPFGELAHRIFSDDAEPAIGDLVVWVGTRLPANPQSERANDKLIEASGALYQGYTEEALHLLLEAKDCAVRALLFKRPIEIYDIVRLKSGGPDMRVIDKLPDGTCVCRWDGDDGQNHAFPEACIERVAGTLQ